MLGAAVVVSLALVVGVAPSLAGKTSGTKRSEAISGGRHADNIKGRGGNDRLKGRGGNDTLSGGPGRDLDVGGPGADRMIGGPGDDVINAADGRRDRVINGGKGNNTCIIDTALELSIVRGCSAIQAPAAGGGTGAAPAPGNNLRLLNATGLTGCTQTVLPLCPFTITGDGADALTGVATGLGGVALLGGGLSVTALGSNWTAAGVYSCTADGFIRVTFGSESVDVPVDCA